MRHLFLISFLLLLSLAPAPGQGDSRQREGRVLFVVNVSSAMARYAPVSDDYLSKLVLSGGGGLLQSNDTFSLWRFNTNVIYDFPLKRWTPGTANNSATQLFAYLKNTKYLRDANFNSLKEPLNRIVADSDKLWIVIITDGKSELLGTPFDKEINAIYKTHFKDLRRAKVPFVTVLAVRDGAIRSYSVNSALASLRLPYMPPSTNSPAAKPPVPAPLPEVKKVKEPDAARPITNEVPAIKTNAAAAIATPPAPNLTSARAPAPPATNAIPPIVPAPVSAPVTNAIQAVMPVLEAVAKPPLVSDSAPPKEITREIPGNAKPAALPANNTPVVEELPKTPTQKPAESNQSLIPIIIEPPLAAPDAAVTAPAGVKTNDWSAPFVSPSKEMMAVQVRLERKENGILYFTVAGLLAAGGLWAVWMLKRARKPASAQGSLISATLKRKD